MIGILTVAIIAATPCEGLKTVQFSNATVTKAEFVAEGVFVPVQAPSTGQTPAPQPAAASTDAARKPPARRPHLLKNSDLAYLRRGSRRPAVVLVQVLPVKMRDS